MTSADSSLIIASPSSALDDDDKLGMFEGAASESKSRMTRNSIHDELCEAVTEDLRSNPAKEVPISGLEKTRLVSFFPFIFLCLSVYLGLVSKILIVKNGGSVDLPRYFG